MGKCKRDRSAEPGCATAVSDRIEASESGTERIQEGVERDGSMAGECCSLSTDGERDAGELLFSVEEKEQAAGEAGDGRALSARERRRKGKTRQKRELL